jgi:hypothetical protein
MRGIEEAIRRSQSPQKDRGHTVEPTDDENPDTPELNTAETDGAHPEVIGLGHVDAGRKILKNIELLGALQTLRNLDESAGAIDVNHANAWVVRGAAPTITLTPPMAVPAEQKVTGVKVRQVAAQVVIAFKGATNITWPSNIRWGMATSGKVTVPGTTPVDLDVQPSVPQPTGGVDFACLTYFEPLSIWLGLFLADEKPADPVTDTTEQEAGDDESADGATPPGTVVDENGNKVDDGTGQHDDSYSDDFQKHPPAGDTYTDTTTGITYENRLKLFALCNSATYYISENGGGIWLEASGPWLHPVGVAAARGAVVVATSDEDSDYGGVLYYSNNRRNWIAANVAASTVDLTVANPGFESGITGWEITGPAVASDGYEPQQQLDSTKYLTSDGTTAGPFTAAQNITIPSANYAQIDAGAASIAINWMQRAADDPNAGDPGRVGVIFRAAGGTTISEYWSPSEQPNGWTQRTHIADIPANTRSIRLVAEGEAEIDPGVEELPIVNGTFSLGLTGWTRERGFGANISYDGGNPYLNMTDGTDSYEGACWYQDVDLPSGIEAIQVDWRQRAASNLRPGPLYNDPGRVTVTFYDEASLVVGSAASSLIGELTWFERTLESAVPESATRVRIRLDLPGDQQYGPYPNVHFDDVRAFALAASGTIISNTVFDDFSAKILFKSGFTDIAASSGRFIAVGEKGAMLGSDDGRAWTRISTPVTGTFHAVAAEGIFWAAIDTDGNLIVSKNGGASWGNASGTAVVIPTGITNARLAVHADKILISGEGGTLRLAVGYGSGFYNRTATTNRMRLAWDASLDQWSGIDETTGTVRRSTNDGSSWTVVAAEVKGPVGPISDTSIGRLITCKSGSQSWYWRSDYDSNVAGDVRQKGAWYVSLPIRGATFIEIIET